MSLKNSKIVVIKIGSSLLVDGKKKIRTKWLSSFAKDCGCSHLEGYGRKAWIKVLKKYNWEPEYIAYRMEIDNG